MKSEHYKNNPNDSPPTAREQKLSSKHNKLKHKHKVGCIKNQINIRLLKQQVKQDTRIKEMFIKMFPNEYREAFSATMGEYGWTEKREVRKEKIIKSMRLKDRNILK